MSIPISENMPKVANPFPDINLIDGDNPVLTSPNTPFALEFYHTRDSLDADNYKNFLKNAIFRFRHSVMYTHYKGSLMALGLDHCQIHKNINSEVATIEMHHNMITIFDIALILSEYMLKTYGRVSTFDLVQLMKDEHAANRIQLVMLSLTPHQLYHNEPEFFIHPDQCFGKWWEFLEIYHIGITQDIAFKILFYLKQAIEEGGSNDYDLLELREKIKDWSDLNANS
jgi:hypothetical protein